MADEDLRSEVDVVHSIDPQTLTGQVTGSEAELKDARSATILFIAGVVTDGTFTPVVQEAADDGSGASDTFSDVAAEDLIGPDLSDFTSTNDQDTQAVGYRGSEPFIRARYTEAGSSNGGEFAAVIVKGGLRNAPTWTVSN